MFQQSELIQEMGNLRKFAFRLTSNASEADDLLQSTLLRALEKKDLFQDGTSLFKWTAKIMFNLFASQYRRRTKFGTKYDPESFIERESVAADQEIKLEFTKVRSAMESLSDDHRDILIMVCIKGMQYQEVADLLAIPVGTVRSRLSRAREQLQSLMGIVPEDGVTSFTPPALQLNLDNARAA